jgi:hypothetical protein
VDAEAEGDAALGAAWLLLIDDTQPAIDNEATIASTIAANNFFIIQVPDEKINQKRKKAACWLKCGLHT